MKKLSKKQLVILSSIIAVAVIGVVVFFVITSKKAAADNGKYVIAAFSSISDRKFVLAEVDKDELTGEPFDKNKQKNNSSKFEDASYSSFDPKDEELFIPKHVLSNGSFVESYLKESDIKGMDSYALYLFLYENEYYLLQNINPIIGGYGLCACWGEYNFDQREKATLFYWPGWGLFFSEEDMFKSWESFDETFWNVPVHSFDDLVEFYERIDETYYKIDKEKQEIYVKGIEELTGKVTEDYFVKLIVDDEGIQIVIL